MTRALQIALLALLVTATGAILFLGWDAHKFLTSAASNSADLTAILQRVNGPTGPITETDKLLLALKSTTVHADMVIAHEDKQLDRYDGYVAGIADSVRSATGRINDVSVATVDVAHSASTTLQTANATIAAVQPVLANLSLTEQASTRTLDSLNARIRDPQLDAIMAHIDSMTDSSAAILADGRKVTDKLTTDYLTPVPWYKQPGRFYRVAMDAALLAK